jgi:hypothetical protein
MLGDAGGGQLGVRTQAEDDREEHEREQPAQQRRHPDMTRPPGQPRAGHTAGRGGVRAAPAARAEHDPVDQRVERKRDEIVQQDRRREPLEHPHDLARSLKPAGDRDPRDHQSRDQQQKMARTGAVALAQGRPPRRPATAGGRWAGHSLTG